MLVARWSGRSVEIFNEHKQLIRRLTAMKNVVGVQCSGNNIADGMVSIAEEGGRTELFKANGVLVRRF